MGRRSALVLLAAGVSLALLVWPREARLGTYGSHTLVRRGFTVAADINVGSHSDPSREDEIFRSRGAAIEAQVKPLLPLYTRWYERALTHKHAYTGWLGALDRTRAAATAWDYRWRLPAPVRRATAAGADPGSLLGAPSLTPLQLYLHMRADGTELARGRALIGFALAQIALGDGAELVLPAADPRPLVELVKHTAGADSFAGQPRLIGALLVAVRGQAPELLRLTEDPAQGAEVRLLARLCLIGLRPQAWTPADWQKVAAARSVVDRRTLWTWVLLFTDEPELVAREAELRRQLPLSPDDERSFYRRFIVTKGPPE